MEAWYPLILQCENPVFQDMGGGGGQNHPGGVNSWVRAMQEARVRWVWEVGRAHRPWSSAVVLSCVHGATLGRQLSHMVLRPSDTCMTFSANLWSIMVTYIIIYYKYTHRFKDSPGHCVRWGWWNGRTKAVTEETQASREGQSANRVLRNYGENGKREDDLGERWRGHCF